MRHTNTIYQASLAAIALAALLVLAPNIWSLPQGAQDADLKAKIRASDLAERAKGIDVDRSLEIKPALFLPDGVGFYSLEGKLIYEMKQSLAVSKLSKGREAERILSGIPLIPRKMTLEIRV